MPYRLWLVAFLDIDTLTHVEIEHAGLAYTETLCGRRTSAYWATTYKDAKGFATCGACSRHLLSASNPTPSPMSRPTDEKDQTNESYYSADRAVARRSRWRSNSKTLDTGT